MPSQYRIEVSPNNRAGCKSAECREDGVKITKGELRFGVLIEIPNRGSSWSYRHWGCVTPRQIENLKEAIENDIDLFDGYDELPDHLQEKMRRTLEQGHVDDEDWKGDPEYNRPGMNGMRKRTPRKKATQEENGDDETNASPSKPAPKKRGRAAKEENDEAAEEGEPAPKKAKGRAHKGKKAEETMEEEESKAGIKGKDTLAEDEDGEETKLAGKKRARRRGARGKKVKTEEHQDEGSDAEMKNGYGNLDEVKMAEEEALKYELPDDEDEPEKAGPSKKSRARAGAGAGKKKRAGKNDIKAKEEVVNDGEVENGEAEMNPEPEQVENDENMSEVETVSKGKKKATGGSEKTTKGKGRKKAGKAK